MNHGLRAKDSLGANGARSRAAAEACGIDLAVQCAVIAVGDVRQHSTAMRRDARDALARVQGWFISSF